VELEVALEVFPAEEEVSSEVVETVSFEVVAGVELEVVSEFEIAPLEETKEILHEQRVMFRKRTRKGMGFFMGTP
jgi:hypothetical protein